LAHNHELIRRHFVLSPLCAPRRKERHRVWLRGRHGLVVTVTVAVTVCTVITAWVLTANIVVTTGAASTDATAW